MKWTLRSKCPLVAWSPTNTRPSHETQGLVTAEPTQQEHRQGVRTHLQKGAAPPITPHGETGGGRRGRRRETRARGGKRGTAAPQTQAATPPGAAPAATQGKPPAGKTRSGPARRNSATASTRRHRTHTRGGRTQTKSGRRGGRACGHKPKDRTPSGNSHQQAQPGQQGRVPSQPKAHATG